MAEELIKVEVDTSHIQNQLSQFNQKMPHVAKRLMKSVNAEVKRQIKQEAQSRGYHGSKKQSWGDSGFRKNLKSYENTDFSAKVMMAQNAFYYRFIEFGANVQPQNVSYLCFKIGNKILKSKGFSYPARPLIYPIANSIWGTTKADQIMEQRFQQELDRIFKDSGVQN